MDRYNNIVSEPEDREEAVEHIIKALERCGYPSWTRKKMKEQQSPKGNTKEKKDKNVEKSKSTHPMYPVKKISIFTIISHWKYAYLNKKVSNISAIALQFVVRHYQKTQISRSKVAARCLWGQ